MVAFRVATSWALHVATVLWVDYVKRQREHHASGRVEDRLERITQIEVSLPEGGRTLEARFNGLRTGWSQWV